MREMDEYKKMPQDTETREAEKETFKACELSEEGFLGEPFVIIEEEEESKKKRSSTPLHFPGSHRKRSKKTSKFYCKWQEGRSQEGSGLPGMPAQLCP